MTNDVLKIRAKVLIDFAKEWGLSKEMLIKFTETGIVNHMIKATIYETPLDELHADVNANMMIFLVDNPTITTNDLTNFLNLAKMGLSYKVLMKVVDGKLKFSELKVDDFI